VFRQVGKTGFYRAVPAVKDAGRGYGRAPLQALRDGVAPGQVLVAGDHDQLMIRVLFEKGSGTLGHGFVPQQLGLEKMLEVFVPLFFGMQVEYLFEALAVGCIGRCNVGW
jgi:hypothetical protein